MPLNISLDQFRSISDGKYNAGQVDVTVNKDGSATLKEVNTHVHLTALNTATIDPAQTLEIKQAFVRALAPHVSEDDLAAIRENLGLPATEGGIVRAGHAYEPLTRQEVRAILDAYVPPEVRQARAEEAKRTSVRASVNAANLSALPIHVGDQALKIDQAGTPLADDADAGLRKAADDVVNVLSRQDGKSVDLAALLRNLNTVVAYAERSVSLNPNPPPDARADVARLVNATLARALDRLDNAALALVYQGMMSREVDGLKSEISRRMDSLSTLPSQFDICKEVLEGVSRLEARVVSEVSYRVMLGKTPQDQRADIQSPVQRWCGDDAAPTAHDDAHDMTVTNLEIIASRATDALMHSDAVVKGVDERLRSHGLTKTDTRAIGDMIRGTELTMNVHLGSIVGWHGTLTEPALKDPEFALRNTFASKEAQGLELDGTGYLVKRDEVEKYFFPEYGTVPLSGRERPLYAAFNPAKTVSGGIGSSSSYGTTVIVLKPHVKQQATYTLNDTFFSVKLSTTPESRHAFEKGLATALADKVAPETIRALTTPGTDLYSAIDNFYAAQGGKTIDASKSENTICLRLEELLVGKYNKGAKPLDANHFHAIMIRETAVKRNPSSLTATFDNIEDLLASGDDFQAVGFGVSTLRRGDAPFRLLGCDYIEAQLHGPIVLGRDVEEIRVSEKEISKQAQAEYDALAEKPKEGPDKWIADRIQKLKDEIAEMAEESGVKISFHVGIDENGVIAGENYLKDVRATRRLVMGANLKIAEGIVANEMPTIRQMGYAGLSEDKKATLAQAFGADLAQMPDWLKDKIGTVARQQVIASIKDIRSAGESAVEETSIRTFITEKARDVMGDAAALLAALDRHGETDPEAREKLLREFMLDGLPGDNADAYVAVDVAKRRVPDMVRSMMDAVMTSEFPTYIRTELWELGAADGLPLGKSGLSILARDIGIFLEGKRTSGITTTVEQLLAEAQDKIVKPALTTRIDLLRSIANLEFPSVDERKAFVSWAVNSGKLQSLEELKGVYTASGFLVDTLLRELDAGPIDGDKMIGIFKQFFDITSFYGMLDAPNHYEFGTDDRNTLVDRPVSVAMSRLILRAGPEVMDKLNEVLSSKPVLKLFAAASSAYDGTSALDVNDTSAPTPFTMLMAFLGRMGSRINEKFGQHCPIDAAKKDYIPIPFKDLPPELRNQLAVIAPDQIRKLSAVYPYVPSTSSVSRIMPPAANPVGLPTDLAGRKGFLRAALPTYHRHEQTFEKGRNTHGRTHATRAFVLANVLGNILIERGVPVDMNALSLGIAGHDMGRQASGPDYWEGDSGDLTVEMGERVTSGACGAEWCGAVKANIAGHTASLDSQRTIEGYLHKAADSLDYTRVAKIDPHHLHFMDTTFFCDDTIVLGDPDLRRKLIKEAVELTRLTDPYTARLDDLNRLMKQGKIEEYQKLKDQLALEEIDQTDNLSDEQIIELVENTIHANLDKFPILNQYYR